MGTAFDVLVLLHVLCIIGGFGGLVYNGLYLSLAQRRPGGGTSAVLEVNRLVSSLGEALIYAALLFGIGTVAASHKKIGFGDAWVSAAFGAYVAILGVLHGWIRPNWRRYSAVVGRLEKPVEPGEVLQARQADVETLKALERRVGLGWGVFNLLLIGAVYLMVFTPGS